MFADDSDAPKDKYHFAYAIVLFLGIGLLFPWNAFISAPDYWSLLFSNGSTHSNVLFWFSIVYNWPNVIALLILVFWAKKFSFRSRIIFGFVLDAAALIFVPIIDNSYNNPAVTIWLTYLGVGVCGFATGILFGSVTGYAAHLPAIYMQAIMAGNGVAGIIVAILRIVTKLTLPDTLDGSRTSTLIYFVIAGFVVFMCALAFVVLERLPYVRWHMSSEEEESIPIINRQPSMRSIESVGAREEASVLRVLRKVWRNGLAVLVVFFVTLALFPGVIAMITTGNVTISGWFTIILISLFQLFDFVGRMLPRWFTLFTKKSIWIPTLIRFVFFPLFVLCVRKIIPTDGLPIGFMVVFALTNGFLGSVGMMLGPVDVQPHEKETAGIIMTFFLNIGILAGVSFALVMAKLVTV